MESSFILLTYLFVVVLGHYYMGFFSSCSEWGLLIAVASLVAEHRL